MVEEQKEENKNLPGNDNIPNSGKRPWKTAAIVVAILLVLGAGVFGAMHWGLFEREEAVPEEEVRELVGVQEPDIRDMEDTTSIIGAVEPADQRVVIPELSGRVDRVHVEEGDRVSRGEMLFTLDDADHRLQLEEARAAKRAAETQLAEAEAGAREGERVEAESGVESARKSKEQAEREFERVKALHEEGFVSDQELEQARLQYENAKEQHRTAEAYLDMVEEGPREEQLETLSIQVEQAQTGVRLAERNLERTRVTAPVEGEVAFLEVKEGELAGTAEPAAIIKAPSMQVAASLPERYVNHVSEGEEVLLEVPSFGEEKLEGRITRIGSLPPEGGGAYPVEMNIEETGASERLRAGMFARAMLTIARSAEAMVLPRHALMQDEDRYRVYVVDENNVVEAREVETGLSGGGYVEILSGIEEGDTVVVEGHENVGAGEEVETTRETRMGAQ